MTRYACGVEYDGTDFAGWQFQNHARSVQGDLEQALSQVADHPLTVIGAGRTDAGVHASGQVAHFDSDAPRSERQWLLGANSALPQDVALTWLREVPPDFHARRSALWRVYRYRVLARTTRSPLARRSALWERRPLDKGAMMAAASYLLGERDFSAFRAAACQSKTPMRNLMALSIEHRGELIAIDVKANAFLHHMVRNIVGVLLVVGQGEQAPEWSAAVLASKDRTQGGATAPAAGLSLLQVGYPQGYDFSLPDRNNF